MFPIVAVACTTALALGAVIRKVAAGAGPGATKVNSVGPARPVRPTGSVPTESRRYYQVTHPDMAGPDDFAPNAEGDVVLAAEPGQRVQHTRVSCA